MAYLWIGIGGALGAMARHWVGTLIFDRFGPGFPLGTLVVNLTGSFGIGLVLTLIVERFVPDPAWRLLVVVGFLGGYTTFSSYTYELLQLLESGRADSALLYLLASNVLGLVAVWSGATIARR